MKKKRKELVNPIMNSKVINSKSNGNDNDDVKSFIKIVIIMAFILLLVYGFTYFINKEKTTNDITINYDKMTFGMLFNRPYDEYYVLIYNSTDNNSSEYSSIISTYKENKGEEGYIKLYYIDLNNKLNKDYYNKDKSNPKATSLSDIKVGDLTLIYIKDQKIAKYLEDVGDIKNLLNK